MTLMATAQANNQDSASVTVSLPLGANLKTALGKQRKDGKSAPLQPLTTMQRTHVRRLVVKHGHHLESMYRDRKLDSMQHSVATPRKPCTRYLVYKDKNPVLVPC
ncbi:hypothetical protein Rs2_35825 [Raphanus sativus]|nr:hypothetical protein Rs2_35825 [Raphanus sativus]